MEGGEWSSFNGVYVNDEADFMAQFFPTNFPMATSDDVVGCSSLPHWSYNTKGFPGDHPYLCDNHFLVDNNISLFGSLDEKLGEFVEVEHADNNQFLPKRGYEMSSELEGSDISKKRARISNVEKGKNATRSKKRQKGGLAEEDSNAGLTKQATSDCSSEEESNLSLELSNGASSSGKPRASKGSATDPQSLYARKRRERINERLKVLQGLVPNGTKVDISTMLEEAVQYVKFLQLQIKLLSSDDMWMYAPIAYNGMDIGLNHNISYTTS